MLLTLQDFWILLFSFVGRTFLIKSSLSRMIYSIWLKTKFEVINIPAKILAFRSCHAWYSVAAKLSLREKLTKLLPCQVTVAHQIHSSQPFIILGIRICHKHPTRSHSKNKWLCSSLLRRQTEHLLGPCIPNRWSLSWVVKKLKTWIKKETKNMQNHETSPKYVGYDENKLQETKITEKWLGIRYVFQKRRGG